MRVLEGSIGGVVLRDSIGERRHRHIEGQYRGWYNQGGNTNLNFFFKNYFSMLGRGL